MKLKKIPCLLTGYILFSAIPAYANPLGLTQKDLGFCSQVRNERLQDVAHDDSTKRQETSGGVSVLTWSGSGSHTYDRTSSSNREHRMSEYQSRNCDKLLEAAGQVNIAQINANKEVAIAQMQSENGKYSEDTKRILQTINLAAHRDDNRTEVNNNLINQGGNIALGLIQAGVERKRIAAEVELARINADPNLALLQNWGLKTTSCSGSVVSILIDNKEYCTKPVKNLSVGSYAYIRAEGRLEPISQSSNPLNANNPNPQPTPEPISQSPNLVNTNTNSNPQPTPETGL